MSRSIQVKRSWKAVIAGKLAGQFADLLTRTVRMEVEYQCHGPEADGPRLFALWHNRILGASAAAQYWLDYRPGSVLTSASKDGAILEAAMSYYGLSAVRGSSSRRGAAALIELKQVIEAGHHVCITPDGPRGPCYEIQSGLIKLASVLQVPIIPFQVDYESYWEFNTWDRFRIPKPYSKMKVTFGEEIEIPSELDDESFELQRKRVEKIMNRGLNRPRS